jgi:hypothetical protein
MATYQGSTQKYVEIAFRGKETMLLNVDFVFLPNTTTLVAIIRFVCLIESDAYADVVKFKAFTSRGLRDYKAENEATVHGLALDRVIVPLFNNVCPHAILSLGDHFEIWSVLSDYVNAQLMADGFVLSVEDLSKEIRNMAPDPIDAAQFILEMDKLPKLENKGKANA